jgi:hypothetical protein
MIGGNQLPFRLPCHGGGANTFFFGSPFQHGSAAPVPAFGNTTQMKDHCGNIIGAKSLLYQLDVCGTDVCGGGDCNACPGGVDLVTNTPAGPAINANTWSAAIGTVQLEPTRKLGGKWVQAFKVHHGRYGFLHTLDTGADCVTGVLSNIKYLTATDDLHFRHSFGDGTSDNGDITGARTVNATSGETTSTLISTETITEGVDDGSGHITIVTSYFTNGGAGFNYDAGTATDIPFASGGTTKLDISSWDLHCGSYPRVQIDVDLDLPGFISFWNSGHSTPMPAITDPNNYSYSGSSTDFDVTESIAATFTRTDTTVSWDFTRTVPDANPSNPPTIHHYYGSITLSDAYTCNNVRDHAAAQSLMWVLTDDAKYPYRTDGHTTVAPVVLRNEITTPVDPAGFNTYTVDDYQNPINNDTGDAPFSSGWVSSPKWAQRAWFDPLCYQWVFPAGMDQTSAAATGLTLIIDGAMIGAPLAAGYGQAVGGNPWGVYDRAHENWFRRNCIFGVGWSTGQQSRGNFTPTYLPGNAQKWTDDFHATTLWPCAFTYTDVTGVYLQKWCEIKNKRPSVNFARPFGPDKFLLDETSVYFMSDNTAGVVTLKNGDGTAPTSLPFVGTDIVGGESIGGFYHVSAVGTDTVTLGAKVYDVPAGWNTPSNDGLSCFGKLRYPNAPGMDFIDTSLEVGGRVQITVTNGTPVTLTTATTQSYLSITTPENIDILDANMTVLAANVAATRVDDTHFTVPTAYATIATAKWIIPTGTKYKFADSRSKGDYVHRTWTVRISDSTVLAATQQDACLEFSPCGPSVAGFTPNGEVSAGGDFYPFPASVNNGEVWLGQIQFWMIDPFWQQPHTPVAAHDSLTDTDYDPATDQIVWTMDDGTCQPNFMVIGDGGANIFRQFYPLHPFVEARCTLPTINGDIPPAPAGGLDITAVAAQPGQAFIGNIDGPLVNAIVVPATDWAIATAEQACIDAGGQFADDYEADSGN